MDTEHDTDKFISVEIEKANLTFKDVQPVKSHPGSARKEYFKYKRIIDTHKKLKLSPNTRPVLISELEKFSSSGDDRSAVISLILREFNMWCSESFWKKEINIEKVMKDFATEPSANVKNLFSFLAYDWCCPSDEDNDDMHSMMIKFEAFDKSGASLTGKLCEIAERFEHFGCVCVRILKIYLHELRELKNHEIFGEKLLECLQVTLSVTNSDTKIEILKNIVQVLKKKTEESEKTLDEVKKKVMEVLKHEVTFDSTYKRSLGDMKKIYREKLFELAFMLYEKSSDFEHSFEKFVKEAQNFFGHQWKNFVHSDMRMLKMIAGNANDFDAVKQISAKCEFVESDPDDFCKDFVVFNEPLSKEKEEFLIKIHTFLCTFSPVDARHQKKLNKYLEKINKKLMFGRSSHGDLSIFELLVSDSRFVSSLCRVWEKFQLEEHPIVLLNPNPMGKTIIDYLLVSASNEQLLTMLSTPNAQSETRISRKQKHFMKFFNAQTTTQTGTCLVEHCADLVVHEDFVTFARYKRLLMNYFEEVGEVEISSKDAVVKELLNTIKGEKTTAQQWVELNKILRMMISYWVDGGRHYRKYKEKILELFPPYKLIFNLIEDRVDDFFKLYEKKMKEAPKIFQKSNALVSIDAREFLRDFSFDIFNIALRKNQKRVIDAVIRSNFFEKFSSYQPESVNVSEMHQYTALKLLQQGKEGTLDYFPDEWFTIGVIREFLDSVVNNYNQQYVEMDLRLVSKSSTNTSNDNEDDVITTSAPSPTTPITSTKTLEFIARKSKRYGKELLLHPVVETYVNLKSFIYYGVSQWNYICFLLLFLLPFIPLIVYNHRVKEEDFWTHWGWEKVHYIGIVYLVARETFQLALEERAWNYFKHRSNQRELLLIATAVCLSVASSNLFNKTPTAFVVVLELLFIVMTTISAITLNFLTKDPVYVKSLRKVSLIFLKIMNVFVVILWGLAFCIYIVLGDGIESTSGEDSSVESYLRSPIASFLKVLTMLSGEYSFEQSSMSSFQLLFCLLFVVVSFILFNLIVGISFENIEQIMRESRQLNVEYKIKKLIEMERKFGQFEAWINEKWCLGSFCRLMFQKYKLIRDLEKIYIEMSSRLVFVRVNGTRQRVLTVSSSDRAIDFKIDEEIFAEIREIVERKKGDGAE